MPDRNRIKDLFDQAEADHALHLEIMAKLDFLIAA